MAMLLNRLDAAFRKAPLRRPMLAVMRSPAKQGSSALWLLLLLCGFLFFYGINAGELWRTEGLRAIVAAEFLRSGNWVVPTLYDEPLLTKPPGMYAAIALASWPFGGVTEWTARLPSALAATSTVFLFYWYFGRQLGRHGGFIAALIVPLSVAWLDKVPTAEIDMLQVAWVAAAIVFFLRALESEEIANCKLQIANCKSPMPWWLASLLCVAGGVLTKWTAPAFFYGTVIPLLWWRDRLRLLFGRHHLLSAGVAGGICLAWIAAAVWQTGWDSFSDTVTREALQRLSPRYHREVMQQMPAHHQPVLPGWAEILLHPIIILGMNLPWSAVALVALRPSFMALWDERGRRLLQALHCWVWPNLLFWSIIPEHAPRHSFPLFPGIAGLAAMVWIAWLRGGVVVSVPHRRPTRWTSYLGPGRVLFGLLVLWLIAKLVFVHAVIPHRNADRRPRAKGEQLAAVVPAGQVLYVFQLKDEGIMFYYGRLVRRLPSPAQLPSAEEPLYCILNEAEWDRWRGTGRAEAVQRLKDEQGEPIVLVTWLPP